MNRITRWNPVREIVNLQNEMERLFGQPWSQVKRDELVWVTALDVLEKENEFVVTATVPGINPDDLEITMEDHVLTIKGEVNETQVEENEQYHLRERRYGTFSRTLRLETPIDTDNIRANYENGVLLVHLPKQELVQPKRITIKTIKTTTATE